MSLPAIKIQGLDFFYENTPILQDISATIHVGEFIGIFGPNGGGKTTFLKLLMGLLKPSRGKISLFGKTPRSARSRIGYVPQAMHFDKQFPITVLEVVLMGCLQKATWWGAFSSKEIQRAEQALATVGLAGKEHHPFGTLSGGQAQRVLIARALAANPALLLLDEPTANIDKEAEHLIYKLLSELKKKMTIIMVTHDLQAILQMVDQSLCIHRKLTAHLPKDLCEHFAMGLYHPPLIQTPLLKK